MSDFSEELSNALLQFGKMMTKASVLIEGTIVDVDETAFTCTVKVEVNQNGKAIDSYYYSVPLKVLKGSQASIVEIPSARSNCLILFRHNNIQRPQLFQVDSSDKILIKIGNQTLTIDANGFVFNGGSNDGMVLVNNLVGKLNNLESDNNRLKDLIKSWIPIPNDGGAALKTALSSWYIKSLTPTTKEDIENTNILQ